MSMSRKNTEGILTHLTAAERGEVLLSLFARHPELKEEANAIANAVIDDVSIHDVAEDVEYRVTSIDMDKMDGRAGAHSWGYGQTQAPSRDAHHKETSAMYNCTRY